MGDAEFLERVDHGVGDRRQPADAARFTGAFGALERILVLPWNEKYTNEHVDYLADSIQEAVAKAAVGGR